MVLEGFVKMFVIRMNSFELQCVYYTATFPNTLHMPLHSIWEVVVTLKGWENTKVNYYINMIFEIFGSKIELET